MAMAFSRCMCFDYLTSGHCVHIEPPLGPASTAAAYRMRAGGSAIPQTMTYLGPGPCAVPPMLPGKGAIQAAQEVVDTALNALGLEGGPYRAVFETRPLLPGMVCPRGDVGCEPGRELVPGGMAYVVVLRNADLRDGRKVCMTSGNIAVQVGHVIAKLAQESIWDVAESGIALLSVADSKDLEQLALALANEGTAHVKYEDEGKLYGDGVKVFTALATHPIQKNGSAALKKLRPWKCACNEERLGIKVPPMLPRSRNDVDARLPQDQSKW